jgi:hypothetical protein
MNAAVIVGLLAFGGWLTHMYLPALLKAYGDS